MPCSSPSPCCRELSSVQCIACSLCPIAGVAAPATRSASAQPRTAGKRGLGRNHLAQGPMACTLLGYSLHSSKLGYLGSQTSSMSGLWAGPSLLHTACCVTCPALVPVLTTPLCCPQEVDKEQRVDVLRTALSGGQGDMPGCDSDALSTASTQFIDDMEDQEQVADR